MIAKCISKYPTDQQIEVLGDFNRRQAFGATVGKEYLVLGIAFHINLPGFGTGVQLQFLDDDGDIGFAPLFMFEIVDGRPSKYWEARFYKNGSFEFQPPSFYKEYYHNNLSEGIDEVVNDFKRILALLKAEGLKNKEHI